MNDNSTFRGGAVAEAAAVRLPDEGHPDWMSEAEAVGWYAALEWMRATDPGGWIGDSRYFIGDCARCRVRWMLKDGLCHDCHAGGAR